jgi:hypothetical protein
MPLGHGTVTTRVTLVINGKGLGSLILGSGTTDPGISGVAIFWQVLPGCKAIRSHQEDLATGTVKAERAAQAEAMQAGYQTAQTFEVLQPLGWQHCTTDTATLLSLS